MEDLLSTGVAATPSNVEIPTNIRLGASKNQNDIVIKGNRDYGVGTLVSGTVKEVTSVQFYNTDTKDFGSKTFSITIEDVKITERKGVIDGNHQTGETASETKHIGLFSLQSSRICAEQAMKDLSVGDYAGFFYEGKVKSKKGFDVHSVKLIGSPDVIGKGNGNLGSTLFEKQEIPGDFIDGKRHFKVVTKNGKPYSEEAKEDAAPDAVSVEEAFSGDADDLLMAALALANSKYGIKEEDKAKAFIASFTGLELVPENYKAIFDKLNS
ncbi:MAG: hypothetical protein WC455_10205 [Dehalococcoidia bacterium]|jgi:hypothetical protein